MHKSRDERNIDQRRHWLRYRCGPHLTVRYYSPLSPLCSKLQLTVRTGIYRVRPKKTYRGEICSFCEIWEMTWWYFFTKFQRLFARIVCIYQT